jgi:hypothetical protein
MELCLKDVLSDISDEDLTGLATAARVSVTSSACYENMVKEGGTIEAINSLLVSATVGRPVRILDLWTGKHVAYSKLEETTVGEYIFWRSLEEVLSMKPDQLRKLKLVMVTEPGKARTVSKGRACLKIVLDVVNKLVAKPFAKAFPSSSSGMEKSNHGWNVYKAFFTSPLFEEVFRPVSVEKTPFNHSVTVEDTVWETLYSSSTDFETATDFLNHEMAWKFADGIMTKVGIPSLLKGVVKATCFQEREIEFRGTGFLSSIGEAGPSEGIRIIKVVTGVMMGDPLTKVLLHMVNMCVRRLTTILVNNGIPAEVEGAGEIARIIDEASHVSL